MKVKFGKTGFVRACEVLKPGIDKGFGRVHGCVVVDEDIDHYLCAICRKRYEKEEYKKALECCKVEKDQKDKDTFGE